MGKRIRKLLESDDVEASSASPSSMSPSDGGGVKEGAAVGDATPAFPFIEKREGNMFRIPDHEEEVAPSLGQHHTLQQQPQLLGVRGLTLDVLLQCFKAYFHWTESCIPLSQPREVFLRRAKARLFLLTGGAAFGDDQNVEPASDLLIIAVACRGARNTSVSYRFELQDNLEERFIAEAMSNDSLYNAGFDGLEAVKLMAELRVRGLHPTLPGTCHPSSLQNDVLGRGFTVVLAMNLGLHTGPEQHLSEEANERRRWLFYGTFIVSMTVLFVL